MKTPRPKIAQRQPKSVSPCCTNSTVAVAFWREQIAKTPGFNSRAEGFWAVTLNGERRFTGCHAVNSKAFGDATRFADEFYAARYLREAEEAVLIHARPGVALEASAEDKAGARALILAGRARNCELLDYILVGEKDESHPLGILSFYSRVRGFRAVDPFARPAKKTGAVGGETEAAK